MSNSERSLSHLSFLASSEASPRAMAATEAAAAAELVATVTPKRRSDCWTARSAMFSLL